MSAAIWTRIVRSNLEKDASNPLLLCRGATARPDRWETAAMVAGCCLAALETAEARSMRAPQQRQASCLRACRRHQWTDISDVGVRLRWKRPARRQLVLVAFYRHCRPPESRVNHGGCVARAGAQRRPRFYRVAHRDVMGAETAAHSQTQPGFRPDLATHAPSKYRPPMAMPWIGGWARGEIRRDLVSDCLRRCYFGATVASRATICGMPS